MNYGRATLQAQAINIDCGSYQAYTAADGTVWSADEYYSGGQQAYSGYTVTGSSDTLLYGTAREGYYGDFSYAIPVSNGQYTVTLKFAEIRYWAVGQRIFNVSLNSTPVLTNFDVIASGGYFAALDKSFPLTVTNGLIQINVHGVVNTGLINAISIAPNGSSPPPPPISVSVSPNPATVSSGSTLQFTATVTNTTNTAVTWTSSSGTILNGLLTAPVVSVSTPLTVTATSVADPSKSGSAQVTVTPVNNSPPISVSVSPNPATVSSGSTLQFAATVANTTNTAVTWTSSGGTISNGLLTAPVVSVSTPLTVTATSVADPSKSGSAQVTVTPVSNSPPPAPAINIDCGSFQSYKAADGTAWSADQYYTGGQQIYSGYPVAGTSDTTLYGTARGGYYGDFSYAIPVSNGQYIVTLKFAEIQYWAVGQRVFNVILNGTQVMTNVDLVAQGAYFSVLDRQFPVAVTNGVVQIVIHGVVNSGILNAIQIASAPTQAPVLQLSTSNLTFSGTAGGSNPVAQGVGISNAGGGALNWTATNTQAWLTLSSASGTAPANLSIGVNAAGLAPGTYTDTVTIASAGAAKSPQYIAVTLNLAAPPALSVSTNAITFTVDAGSSNPTSQQVLIANTGGGTLSWNANKTQSWLTLSQSSGTGPATLSLGASVSGLSVGNYSDTVTITAPGAINSPQTVSVALNIVAGPVLNVSTNNVNFSALPGSTLPPSQTLSVTNIGTGTLNWTASNTRSWLTLSQNSGTAPSNISLKVSTDGLTLGTYTDTITVTPTNTAASPQTVTVTLNMVAPQGLSTGLAGYWTFDSGTVTGNTVLDSSGNGLNGTLVGNVTSGTGELGQAANFDGSTGYIYVAPTATLALTQDLTIAAWLKTQNSSRTETIVSKYDSSGSEDGYVFETTAAGYLAVHFGGQETPTNRDLIDGTNKINDGQWHHVAAIIRPGEDVMFYVDGGLSSVYYLTTAGGAVGSAFAIGNQTIASNFFTGSLDDVRVYNRALSTDEIAKLYGGTVVTTAGGQILPNGIAMPKVFPPPTTPTQMARVPYYINNPPRVIPINVGRQLFVDDFLIDQTTLQRTQHRPVMLPNPVLTPGTPISGGAWFNPFDQKYEMWYYDTTNDYRYAYSTDGINWTLPSIPDAMVPNTNEVVPGGDTVWLDLQAADPNQRFKSFQVDYGAGKIYVYFSADGIHWSGKQSYDINTLGDRTTAFWNPFRSVWVNSDRGTASLGPTATRPAYAARARFYSESANLANWTPADPSLSYWTGPDDQDPPYDGPGGQYPELYTLDAVAYESVTVGLFSWFYPGIGYSNYTLPGPILVELGVGFSRDGFSWFRPTRGSGANAFIPASNIPGTWNAYNTQSVGGGFLVVGDELWFYFSARTLQKPLDGVFSTGLAKLRRDGFYSMDAGPNQGTLQTRTVTFSGNHMFVNANTASGQLLVEVLDQNGNVIPGFSHLNCVPISMDSTLQEVKWNGVPDLSSLAGQNVKFKFYLTNGSLYSFWVTPSAQGASYGYVAAGGPGFTGVIDTVGSGH